MGSLYYVGVKKRSKKKRFFLSFFITVFLLILLFNYRLLPHVAALAETEIVHNASVLCAEIVGKTLAESELSYNDLIHIEKNAEGEITAVSADMVTLNALRYQIAKNILSVFRQNGALQVSLPLANLFGILFLSGQGKALSVSVETAGSMQAGFNTSFTEAGINQTIHSINFVMEMDFYYLLPTKTQKMTFAHSFCAAQTIIVGRVPDSLTQINRFSDEGALLDNVSIDDAVDFGNVVH